MNVMRLPARGEYHLHECKIVAHSKKDALEYDLEYANSFWNVCSVCLHERADAPLVGNAKSRDHVVNDIERYYEEFGRWPQTKNDLSSEDEFVDTRTIDKYVESFTDVVDELAAGEVSSPVRK